MKRILLLVIFTFCQSGASDAGSQSSYRFSPDQLNYQLQFNDGELVNCTHKLLKHVPWWRVSCGKREFTVNTWMTVHHSTSTEQSKVTFMYDVSEGTASSGEKLVQFHSHFTDMIVDELSLPTAMKSSMDVQNGQASLVIQVRLRK